MSKAKPQIEMKGVHLTLPIDIINEIERISIKRDMSKANVYRMMLRAGVEQHKDLEKLGIIPTMDFVHYVIKAVKEKARENSSGKQMNLT